MQKLKDLTLIGLIYLAAFAAGAAVCSYADGIVLRLFVFDVAATVVTFFFSVLLRNSSVYDAYWSLTPLVMTVWLYAEARAFAPMQLLFLAVFCLWSVRLTGNWIVVFTGFSYEDWRYRKYRDETPALLWPVVNFWGIHMMPTLIVFAGMLPLFVIVTVPMDLPALPGLAVMLFGIALEFFADRQMHAFLASGTAGKTCRNGLWAWSRHPNYLGEILFWLGVYLTMLPFAWDRWWLVIGFAAMVVLFNVVSIPLAEKRQLTRRADYKDYRVHTSRLLLRRPGM